MTFGLTFEKMLLIGLIAVMLVGPARLPLYAASLARLVKRGREFARGANDRIREELGAEVTDLDWSQLDPRRYDPRRIIREALLEDATPATPTTAAPTTAAPMTAKPPTITSTTTARPIVTGIANPDTEATSPAPHSNASLNAGE